MTTLRVPLNPDTVTVNGDRVRVSLDRFLLLQFDRAIVREQSTLMLFAHGRRAPLDHHLERDLRRTQPEQLSRAGQNHADRD